MMLNATEIQSRCEAIGVLPYIESGIDGSFEALAGLCPRCKQPIEIHLTNGGKLSPSRTLRAAHVFSGNVRCEDNATNEQLARLSAEEKLDFFARRHDEETVKDLSPGLREEILNRLWPKAGAEIGT